MATLKISVTSPDNLPLADDPHLLLPASTLQLQVKICLLDPLYQTYNIQIPFKMCSLARAKATLTGEVQ